MTAALYIVTTLLTLVWVGLVLRALFADRSRGRRRCPNCFYEIDPASGLKCTECGHAAKDERSLAKTHRHWARAFFLSIMILAPAVLTGGIARVQQGGGWSDLPSSIITRLLWLDNQGLHDDVISRIGRGELSPAHAERVVLTACDLLKSHSSQRRANAFEMLNKLGRNSFILTNDRPGTLRPMLEELRPDVSVPILLELAAGDDATDALSAIKVLGHLRDIDVEVVLTLLRSMTHDDAMIPAAAFKSLEWTWRAGEIVKRLPFSPHRGSQWYRLPSGISADGVVTSFAGEFADQNDDHDALLAWLIPIAQGIDEPTEEIKAETDLIARRAMALWLACRIDGYTNNSWALVEQAASHESSLLRVAAINQVFAYRWSGEVEAILRAGLASQDTYISAQGVAGKFGTDASSLLPDMLAAVSRDDRKSGTSSTLRDFIALGGNPRDLHDVLVDRLERVLKKWPDSISIGSRYMIENSPGLAAPDLELLADMGIEDQRATDLMLAYMRQKKGEVAELNAAIAYAAITGDKALATRTILAYDPDLGQALMSTSPQYKLWDLMRRDLADIDLIIAHYVDTDDPSRRNAFANLFATYFDREILHRFEPALRTLEADPDPATAAAATKALQALDR